MYVMTIAFILYEFSVCVKGSSTVYYLESLDDPKDRKVDACVASLARPAESPELHRECVFCSDLDLRRMLC